MDALVTGSTGFIGSHLAEALVSRGYRVYCLLRETSNPETLSNLDVCLITGGFQDKKFLADTVRGMDYVFHVGAVIHAREWKTYEQANIQSTVNLLEACAESNPGLKKFVFVSSIAAAGPSRNKRPVKESDDCHPVSFYGRSKLKAELAIRRFFDTIPVVIIRPTHVLGIRQKELIFFMKLVEKRLVPLLGNRDKQISICFVQDLVRSLIMAAENASVRSETYFVANEEPYSWQELLFFIRKELGISPVLKIPFPLLMLAASFFEMFARVKGIDPFVTRENILGIRKNYWIHDVSKIKRELGFTPEINFEQEMKSIVGWYREQGQS